MTILVPSINITFLFAQSCLYPVTHDEFFISITRFSWLKLSYLLGFDLSTTHLILRELGLDHGTRISAIALAERNHSLQTRSLTNGNIIDTPVT